MYEVKMPMFGATMKTGEINEWFVKVGDSIKEGDQLCEISSSKITNTLESLVNGVVKEIVVDEGEEAAVGATIALVEEA